MSRTAFIAPWFFVATLAAQVPTPPVPPTPPRPARAPLVMTPPRLPASSFPFDQFDVAPAWPYAFDTQVSADYARAAADYAREATDYAMNNLQVFGDVGDRFGNGFGKGFGGSFNGGGPVAWAQDDPADSLYRSARDQLNRGDYRKAAALFKSLPQKYPNSPYVADAEYWQAFSLYRIGGTPELQEALAVLEARKPAAESDREIARNGRRAANQDARVATAPSVAVRASVGVTVNVNGSFRVYRGQTDAAGLAARIASVLSSRGLSNDAAVKRALAAAGTSCDEEDQSVRAEALGALMQNDPETGRQMAIRILANRDECSVPLRLNAVMLVASKHDDAAVTTLLPVAKSDPSARVRMGAIEYLARQQTDAAVNAVIEVARSDTSTQMQRVAVRALGASSNPRARAEVRSIVESNNTDEGLRISAIDGLDRDRMTADDATWLRALYARTTSPRIKERIISAVAGVGGDANNQWLLALARNDDESLEIRTAALSRVGRNMDVATLDKLYDTSSQRPVRETVIELLSERKEPEALDKIVDIARNGTDPSMRRQAIGILARSKDPRASKLLLQLVDKQ